jgi:hypothetical protein
MSRRDRPAPPLKAARERSGEGDEGGNGAVPLSAERASADSRKWSRRRILACGFCGSHRGGVRRLRARRSRGAARRADPRRTGRACSVSIPAETFAPAGPSRSGRFFSAARNRTVGYTIAYPPGQGVGSALPLVVSLHGFGGNHLSGLGGLSLSAALAGRTSAVVNRQPDRAARRH